MWVTTTRGFFSIVQDRDNPLEVLIRARDREDLESLCELRPMQVYASEIEDTPPPADYPARIRHVNRSNWDHALLELSQEIDYPNFKKAVGERHSWRREGIYGSVWSVLHRITNPSRADRARPGRNGEYEDEPVPLWMPPDV